jgi:arylsulfatase A-like enzyme
VAIDRDFDLILLHWPIPHRPGIYSRSRDDFDDSGRGTYVDNLALVDRTLRELRQALEKAGVWDSTTTLLSADHWDRYSMQVDGKIDHRVPFLLKLAGQTTRLDYYRRFDTVATHDLILSILSGELQDPESVARWLDRRNDPNPFAALDPASPEITGLMP